MTVFRLVHQQSGRQALARIFCGKTLDGDRARLSSPDRKNQNYRLDQHCTDSSCTSPNILDVDDVLKEKTLQRERQRWLNSFIKVPEKPR